MGIESTKVEEEPLHLASVDTDYSTTGMGTLQQCLETGASLIPTPEQIARFRAAAQDSGTLAVEQTL